MDSILTDWEERHARLFGQHILRLHHRLYESPLFADEALARLIERTTPEHCYINTMDKRAHNPRTRREGAFDGLSGEQALEAVRNGNIWINIHKPGVTEPKYARLLDEVFAEFEGRIPGLKTYRQSMTLLISSPKVQVYYHCDVPGQMLWQMRGAKTVYVYPNEAPFLTDSAMEKIILGESHETGMPYEPWFEEYARAIELRPGDMLHWPLNCPHRVVNQDSLNVSMTTEHWTNEIRNLYAANFANGILRRSFPSHEFSRRAGGPAFWGKLLLAAAYKSAGLHKTRQRKRQIDFAVDPSAPDGIRDIPAYAFSR